MAGQAHVSTVIDAPALNETSPLDLDYASFGQPDALSPVEFQIDSPAPSKPRAAR